MSLEQMDFDEIAAAQGWNDRTIILLLREYISSPGWYESLDSFAREKAYEENLAAADPDLWGV